MAALGARGGSRCRGMDGGWGKVWGSVDGEDDVKETCEDEEVGELHRDSTPPNDVALHATELMKHGYQACITCNARPWC